jgi:tetratricopeptide (TPR) repeat protein
VLTQYDADVRDTAARRFDQPGHHSVLGEIALAEGKPLEAVSEFRASDMLPDGPASGCLICLYANLARAYDQANNGDSAIAMFERYVDTPQLRRMEEDADFLAGALKRLGELYDAQGNKAKAASYFARFVDLWKNADPELQPQVAEARRKLQTLSRAETGVPK